MESRCAPQEPLPNSRGKSLLTVAGFESLSGRGRPRFHPLGVCSREPLFALRLGSQRPRIKKAPLEGAGLLSLSSSMTRWFAVSSGQVGLDIHAAHLGLSRHHEHLIFPAETHGAWLRLLSRGPRVHARVVSFLTTRKKFEVVVTRARVDPRVFCCCIPSTSALPLRITVCGSSHVLSEKILSRRCLRGLIVLVPCLNSMSPIVDKRVAGTRI